MRLNCKFARRYFCTGDIVTVLVEASELEPESVRAQIYAQAHAHVTVNEKWLSLPTPIASIFRQHTTSYHIQKRVRVPRFSQVQRAGPSACVFITPREPLGTVDNVASGSVVQFEIPESCLPTFRGYALSISYMLTITVELNQSTYDVHFPLLVLGSGSSESPHHVRFSPLASTPLECFPPSVRQYPQIVTEELASSTRQAVDAPVFAVRDGNSNNRLLCYVNLNKALFMPGQEIHLRFDFTQRQAECYLIDARLVMNERTTAEGRLIQKTVAESARLMTRDLLYRDITFSVPVTGGVAFSTPLVRAEWILELEFQLEEHSSDTLTWSTGVVITASGALWEQPDVEEDVARCLEGCFAVDQRLVIIGEET